MRRQAFVQRETVDLEPPVPSSLHKMGNQAAKKQPGRPTPKDLWKLVLAIIGVIAVVQELRKPPEMRNWHGKVAGIVPYDFRMPTFTRFRETYWNPERPVLVGKAWGVGWAPNFAAVKKLFNS